MHACPRYPVVQYDGTADSADAVMAVLGSPYWRYEQRTVDGAPVLVLIDWWDNETPVTTTAYCCNREILQDLAALEQSYYIVPETP